MTKLQFSSIYSHKSKTCLHRRTTNGVIWWKLYANKQKRAK